VAAGGRAMDAALSGKWICPMHPEIIKPESGSCDTCEMPLVKAESLGYTADDPAQVEKPLVIPASAALITGTRAVVYVQKTDSDRPTFEGREVKLGPRAQDYYLVRSGLEEGELVVVKGNFKIDSALQILAKPSMMMPDDETADHAHGGKGPSRPVLSQDLADQLGAVYQGYFTMQTALAGDDASGAAVAAGTILEALGAVDMTLFDNPSHYAWMQSLGPLRDGLTQASQAGNIKVLREHFHPVSQHLIKLSQTLGAVGTEAAYIMHCPMAFDNTGAHWLQNGKDLRNPYFGAVMLKCGTVEETIAAAHTTDGGGS